MRAFRQDRYGISNVIGYLFSLAVASMVMVSAIFVTMNIIEDKTSQVADLEAQSVANYVANAIVEAIAAKQSISDADYSKMLDIPIDLAGKNYYIDITGTAVYVNTTDGSVSKKCSIYNVDELDIGISTGRIYSSFGGINVSYNKNDYVYKLDFGVGNITSHSPVEAGYCMVSDESKLGLRDEIWYDDKSPYRVPILVSNPSLNNLVETPVKIVLNPSNFDYSKVTVTPTSGDASTATSMDSDLVFYDPGSAVIATIDDVNPGGPEDPWYTYWQWDWKWESTEVVDITIGDLTEGYLVNYIKGDTVKLNNYAECISYSYNEVEKTGVATFNRTEAFDSLTTHGAGVHEITITGELKDGVTFYGTYDITVALGDIFVDNDFDENTPGWGVTHFDNIQDGLDAAEHFDTVYVYDGTYTVPFTGDNAGHIHPWRPVNLVGESWGGTIIDGTGSYGIDGISWAWCVLELTESNDYSKICSLKIERGHSEYGGDPCDGILLTSCKHVQVAHCIFTENRDGIHIRAGSENNYIIDCWSYKNMGDDNHNGGDGILIEGEITANKPCYNHIIDCDFYWNNNDGEGEEGNGISIYNGAHDNIIENCKIRSNKGKDSNGIRIHDDYSSDPGKPSSINNVIINCEIYGHRNPEDDKSDGIEISGVDQYGCEVYPEDNKIINCTIYHNDGGIYLFYTDSNSIIDCTVRDNDCAGIWVEKAGDTTHTTTILNCKVYDNGWSGIYFELSYWNEITGCNVYGNGVGSDVLPTKDGISLIESDLNSISKCNVFDNHLDGIYFEKSAFNTIEYCNLFENGDAGIDLDRRPTGVIYSNYNYIHNNNIYKNDMEGIVCEGGPGGSTGSHHNFIYNNNFAFNNPNAKDEYKGSNEDDKNDWEDVSQGGNFWDDYDGDGNPYPIPGWPGENDDDLPSGPNWDDAYTNPDIIKVDDDYGSTDHYRTTSIKEGVDNVRPGGKVLVYPGTYEEQYTITIDKSLRLIAVDENGDEIGGDGVKPIIKYDSSSNNHVIEVTGMTSLPQGFDSTIIIDSFEIDGSGKSNAGISVDIGSGVGDNYVNISNCYIHDCYTGITLASDFNNVVNCEVYDNDYGLQTTGDSIANTIANCSFHGNTYGIDIEESITTRIENCTVEDNECGIRLLDAGGSGEGITIIDCTCSNNNEDGIRVEGTSSTKNKIIRCNIDGNGKDSDESNEYYGVRVTGSSDNHIFHNRFEDNGKGIFGGNAYDSGSNTWDNGDIGSPINEDYAGGGNYWDDYDGVDESPSPPDGIGDTPYNISGKEPPNQDGYPFPMGKDAGSRPYSIEYWNPYGESVILVSLGLAKYQEKYIYLYYGSEVLESHGFDEIAAFDNFNSVPGSPGPGIPGDITWTNPYYIDMEVQDGKVIINAGEYFISTFDLIDEPLEPDDPDESHTFSEAMYIVEARMKLDMDVNVNQGNLILLSQSEDEYDENYMVSIHTDSSTDNYIYLHKMHDGGGEDQLDYSKLPSALDHWLRVKSYIYVSKHKYNLDGGVGGDIYGTNIANISSYIYDFTSFADEGNVTDTDGWNIPPDGEDGSDPTGENDGEPYLGGKIGLGCGLRGGGTDANIKVDWIRVMKTPIVSPTITVGAQESINYGWGDNVYELSSVNRAVGNNPFEPGPVLRDFNKGASCDLFHFKKTGFVINLPDEDTYTITVTKGDEGGTGKQYLDNMTVTIWDLNNNNYGTLYFDETEAGEFQTEWSTIKWPGGDLMLVFKATGSNPGGIYDWTVDSIIIERGEKDIRLSGG